MNLLPSLPLVIIESPFAGRGDDEYARRIDHEVNRDYALRCLADSIRRGEAPFASHLLYPQVLDESVAASRTLGIELGYAWGRRASLIAFYIDRGFTPGMEAARKKYDEFDIPCINRSLTPLSENKEK